MTAVKNFADTVMEMTAETNREQILEKCGCVMVAPSDYKGDLYTYTYTKEVIDRSDIDQTQSRLYAQNRINGKLDSNVASKYACCLKRGDKFPALVLFKMDNNGRYLKADGNHTDDALRQLGVQKISGVYLFSHPEPFRVAAILNSKNGFGEDLDDTLERAVADYNLKRKECEDAGKPVPTKTSWAQQWGVPDDQFNRACKVKETHTFLAFNAVDTARIKHDKTYEHISRVQRFDGAAAVQIANMAAAYELQAKDVEELVNSYLDNSKTTEDKKGYLANAELEIKKRTNNGKANNATKGQRVKNRSPEVMCKDMTILLAQKLSTVDINAVQNMMSDEKLKDAVGVVSRFFKLLK